MRRFLVVSVMYATHSVPSYTTMSLSLAASYSDWTLLFLALISLISALEM
jgi:hypothetical protein